MSRTSGNADVNPAGAAVCLRGVSRVVMRGGRQRRLRRSGGAWLSSLEALVLCPVSVQAANQLSTAGPSHSSRLQAWEPCMSRTYPFTCAFCKQYVGGRTAYYDHGHFRGWCKRLTQPSARSSAAAARVPAPVRELERDRAAAAAAAASPLVADHGDDQSLGGGGGADVGWQLDADDPAQVAAAAEAARAFRLAMQQAAEAGSDDTDAEPEPPDSPADPDANHDQEASDSFLSSASVPAQLHAHTVTVSWQVALQKLPTRMHAQLIFAAVHDNVCRCPVAAAAAAARRCCTCVSISCRWCSGPTAST